MYLFKDQQVLILGLGASGLAMARWCYRQGARVIVADTRSEPPFLNALNKDCPLAKFICGTFSKELIYVDSQNVMQTEVENRETVKAVFKSPGLTPLEVDSVLKEAKSIGLWVGTELSLFSHALEHLKNEIGYEPSVLAVTGTNGKTTVTSLTHQMLQRGGVYSVIAGNIGPTMLDTLVEKLIEMQAHDHEIDAQNSLDLSLKQETDSELSTQASNDSSDIDLKIEDKKPEKPKYKLPEAWVLELSSFQLNDTQGFDPTSAVILNITEDHLDWHGDMQTYAYAKSKIFGKHTTMILYRDDPFVVGLKPPEMIEKERKKAKLLAEQNAQEWFEPDVITFGNNLPTVAGDYGLETVNGMTWLVKGVDPNEDESEHRTRKRKIEIQSDELLIQRLMPADALRIRGTHNALNALAALALCSTTKATKLGHGPMLYALREYQGEPHRVEPVARINDVEYFDDSKGTNVGATLAAINGLGPDFSLIVILGGEGKGQDFRPLSEPLSKYAKLVLLIGRDAPTIEEALKTHPIKIINAPSLTEAVEVAHQHANLGDAVLMSPACASFDMFDNYEHRATVFVQAVKDLAHEEGVV